MKPTRWIPYSIKKATYLGVIEFNSGDDEEPCWHDFHVFASSNALIFGGFCNAGFIESGHMHKDGCNTDVALQELADELETFYRGGCKPRERLILSDSM